ncbi:MAG: 1-acyl-sn-glycerol-3-phosphate acyltransferase [Pirellulaceae bacterium]|jgi:1-acyl-sn-glycerol-3-phosphate acyltransferase|nr:1-acyl-sn-glycerol-3-phosphate acyltransferase [Pirellulaceae bacterium]
MQQVLIEKPYQFVPAFRSTWFPKLFSHLGLFRWILRQEHGVVAHECRNVERLQDSIRNGHGIMLCSNHPRTADAIAFGHLARETPCVFYVMASWHLFNQGRFRRWLLRMLGGFSVNREGLDRQGVDEAVRILQTAERPLLIFPEGTTSRTNDQLMSLMEGPAFIARTAAKRRAKQDGGEAVVVHPIALKYVFQGDLEESVNPVLSEIERRLTWEPSPQQPLVDRLVRIGNALLTLKELEYGVPMSTSMTLRERQTNMVNRMLDPLETQWLGSPRRDGIAVRIKNLRMKIFPELSRNEIDQSERQRRWGQLRDTYLAQQIDCYPDRYITRHPSVDRILETVEKFDEDINDHARILGNLKVIIDVGEAITVSPERERDDNGNDPLMSRIRDRLTSMLENLQIESRMYDT